MVKLNEKADILLKFFVEGKSKRQIARETGRSRNTVRKYINEHSEKLSKIDRTMEKDKYYKDSLVAEHKRSYRLHECMIDINHYLTTLKRKPGALKNSLALEKSAPGIKKIYKNYFNDNSIIKTKEFIDLLEIIIEKGFDKVEKAITKLSRNKKSMVTLDNIKIMVNRKTPVQKGKKADEIIENSLELLNNYNQVFNVTENNRQEVC